MTTLCLGRRIPLSLVNDDLGRITSRILTLLGKQPELYNNNMVTIVFEAHSTSLDNEKHLSSGWNDVELSPLGIEQARDLVLALGRQMYVKNKFIGSSIEEIERFPKD